MFSVWKKNPPNLPANLAILSWPKVMFSSFNKLLYHPTKYSANITNEGKLGKT